MNTRQLKHYSRKQNRRGAIIVLSAFILAMLAIIAALCLNTAYVELAKSEMRLATDAAAKAASITLGKTGDTAAAQQKAKQICARHIVAGEKLKLRNTDVDFGQAYRQSDGTYGFNEGAQPYNSVRVTSSFARRPGSVAALPALGGLLGVEEFAMEQESLATRIDNDIALVVDRSGSMAWDLTNEEFSYPGDLNGKSAIQNYFLPPHETLSRWAALEEAVDAFLSVLENNPYEPRVSLTSYASNFEYGQFESFVSTVDQELTYDFQSIRTAMDLLGSKPVIGNTNIAAGLRDGIMTLSSQVQSRPNAQHSIVLLTDGVMTQGDDPVALAALALEQNISVHTVTFSDQADQVLMAQVAAAGGGEHYHAPDGETLTEIFRELAETLPAMLVK